MLEIESSVCVMRKPYMYMLDHKGTFPQKLVPKHGLQKHGLQKYGLQKQLHT